jgi:LmbE family N-acetylglucosaminyl deacetylase
MKYSLVCTLLFTLSITVLAQVPAKPLTSKPDDRLKTDILLVVAHPDDETGVVTYLAEVMEHGKRVAVIYLTHGEAGHNNMGPERAASLGAVREMELRHALTSVGIQNVWFLNGRDTPTQDVLQSLGIWGHGAALEQVVRMMRLTRPEVILTWMPGFFVGENHGDHQAAGVVATEAFDLAGDPAVFPAQLAMARHVNETILEGLRPWQPKKIYYFSDAENQKQFQHYGPQFSTTAISPSRGLPYWRIALAEFRFHLSQYRSYIDKLGSLSEAQLTKRASQDGWDTPLQLILGKSVVKSSLTGDVFEGVATPISMPPRRLIPDPSEPHRPLSIELTGPWGFYRRFLPAHDLIHLPQADGPEIAIAAGSVLQIPLLIRNDGPSSREVTLSLIMPKEWTGERGPTSYTVGANDIYPLQLTLTAPKNASRQIQEITCLAKSGGDIAGSIQMHVHLREGGLPQ